MPAASKASAAAVEPVVETFAKEILIVGPGLLAGKYEAGSIFGKRTGVCAKT